MEYSVRGRMSVLLLFTRAFICVCTASVSISINSGLYCWLQQFGDREVFLTPYHIHHESKAEITVMIYPLGFCCQVIVHIG